jgi:murein DD-endopeptidase MepM/ murein hydrolase activator NlpD
MADANQIVRAQQFAHVVAGTSTDALRQYRADREDLRDEQAALEREQESLESALGDLRQRRADAIAEIDRLAEVARRAQAERDRQREAERAAATPAAPAVADGPAITSPSGLGQPGVASAAPPRTNAPATTRAAPAEPAAPAAPAAGGAGWICPVQGPHAFSDDYGAPRGGGSSHQGNDILAPRGTPVVASVAGVVTQRNGAVSGLAYFLAGDDGNRYFGAHLDTFGASGRVAAGTVIGTVGNTGDAAGGPPHLHFEIHPGGSGNTNPYPTLRRYC